MKTHGKTPVPHASCLVPLVSGLTQDEAQWIFSGQPLNTFEKHAPICTGESAVYQRNPQTGNRKSDAVAAVS